MLDLRELAEALGERGRTVGGGDDVDVLDRVRATASGAGELDVSALAGPRQQAADELLANLERTRQQDPRRRTCAGARVELVECREHAFLELRAEAAHGPQTLGEGSLAQRLRRVDAELGVQQPCALGAEARQSRDRNQARRELRS